MPFKANAARRRHISKQTRKVSSWAAYNASSIVAGISLSGATTPTHLSSYDADGDRAS